MTTVCAFDRDHTVDVNPHPDRAAVPLSWVRGLRDCEGVDVWAIGNQRLRYEAGIPGLPELLRRDEGQRLRPGFLAAILWIEWRLHEVPGLKPLFALLAPHVASSTMPPRIDRLRRLERLYGDDATFVVVDDVDLSGVEGWTHYYPWEFVERVTAGRLDLGVESSQVPTA